MTPVRKRTTLPLRSRVTLTAATTAAAATVAAAAHSLALPSVAYAQQGADGLALPTDSGALSNLPNLASTTDVFVGQDRPGPYELTWKKLPVVGKTVAPVVNIDGKLLLADRYTIDFEKGQITFKEPLKASSMARVDYGRDPMLSVRNANPATSPVTISLGKTAGASFQLTAVPNGSAAPIQQASAAKTRSLSLLGNAAPVNSAASTAPLPDTTLVWGASGKTNLMGGGLTSQLYLSPQIKDAKGEDGIFDRSGVSLGFNRTQGRGGIEANWARTGRDFAGVAGKAVGLGDTAQQRQSLAARYSAASWVGMEWGMNEARALAGAGGATGQERMSLRLGGAKALPTLNAARVEDTKSTAEGAVTSVTTDKMDLTAALGKTANLVAKTQQVATDAADDKADVKAEDTALSLAAQSKNKKQTASVAYNESTKTTYGSIEEKQGVQFKLQPTPTLTITAEQQQQVVTPVTAATEDKPAQADPSKAQEVKAQGARAELAVAPGAKLMTGVRTNEVGEDKTAVTEMSAQIGAGKAFDVTQSMVNRSASEGVTNATLDLDTTQTRIAVRPTKGLTLSGVLTVNPEDKGVITEAKRQELGLNAKVGALELGSGYALTSLTAYDGAQTGEFSLSLGLAFNNRTKLSGGYKDALLWGADTEEASKLPRGLRVYTLGLTHNLGNDKLNFTFGGSVTENKQDLSAPNDIKAEAKLGLKF